MKVYFSKDQLLHKPEHLFKLGKFMESPEQPQRADKLLDGIKLLENQGLNVQVEHADDFGMDAISAIHDARYLDYLQNIYEQWIGQENASEVVWPNAHTNHRNVYYSTSPMARAGYHQLDMSCPISENTWKAVYQSAQSAIAAAQNLIQFEAPVYALCRPPGHHAFADSSTGFCFLNNSAVAAQYLLKKYKKVAILDVDVHHGNGTQEIFYHRSDVFTVSIHTDVNVFYPFFWGVEEEKGVDEGLGFNLNIPLPKGANEHLYQLALEKALKAIDHFNADVLVIALGLDTHIEDPYQGMSITTKGLSNIARTITELDLPTVLIQEGGYLSESLGENLASFLTPFIVK